MTISMSESTRTSALSVDIDALVEYLNTASIRLAVFGEFSAGKTTVLNALIGEEILSVAVEPTTAVPTRVRYGREFNIFVERTGGDGPALFEDDPPFWTRFVGRRDTLSTLKKQQDTIRNFLRTWTKEGERAGEVERVVIELPLDWLKGGLELVDTPGVNNEFARHQGFTEQEAGAADIAVLLMDARQGGGKRTEFEFMNEVQSQMERCVVAPNKLDLVPADEREEFLGYIRGTALPKHWDGAVTPPVVGISALAALRPGDHDEPDLVDAFADLRDRLERVAEKERGSLLLARKGNPEKQLFARAKELEGDDHYGRAHRLYFDLLDVLEAAGLDPTPAEEGIARCEEHLSAQVDTLDALNERYNEAMALAEEDPDAALEELTAIRDEKEDLRLKDGDLHASIEELQSRIEKRDAARSRIRVTKTQVEQHRDNENWIEAAEAAQKIPSLIETAELSAERTETLRQFVATQMQDRDEWAENRWMAVKDDADACVEDQRFLDAEEYLDELETVAPYTPFEAETVEFAADVREKAKAEEAYREAVRTAMDEAEVLREDRVDPDAGAAVEETIEKAADRYRAVYGVPDLPDRPPVEASDLPLTIDQKLGLARQLRTVAERAPSRDGAAALVDMLEGREVEIEALSGEARGNPALLREYPDHPSSTAVLQRVLNENVPVWTPPWNIDAKRDALHSIESHASVDDEAMSSRDEELKLQATRAKTLYAAVASLLIGVGVFFVGMYLSERIKYSSAKALETDKHIKIANNLIQDSWFFGGETEELVEAKVNKLSNKIEKYKEENYISRNEALSSYLCARTISKLHSKSAKGRILSRRVLEKTLAAAKKYLEVGNILRPKGKNAYSLAKLVLRKDADNNGAHEVIRKVAYKVKERGNKMKDKGRLLSALNRYQKSLEIDYRVDTNKKIEDAKKRIWSGIPVVDGKSSRNGIHPGPGPDLSANSLETRWKVSAGRYVTSPIVHKGRVYVGSGLTENNDRENYYGKIYAYKAYSGKEEWSQRIDRPIKYPPSAGDSMVFVSTVEGYGSAKIYAFKAGTGEKIWSSRYGGQSIPLIQDSTIYTAEKKVNALWAATGEVRWRSNIEVSNPSSLAARGNRVYVADQNKLYALNRSTGKKAWSFKTTEKTVSSMAVDNDKIYLGSRNSNSTYKGAVHVLDSKKGKNIWSTIYTSIDPLSLSLADSTVIVSGSKKVYALHKKSGTTKWKLHNAKVLTRPIISEDLVFVGVKKVKGTDEGRYIYVVDIKNGGIKFSYKAKGENMTTPAIVGRRFFLGYNYSSRNADIISLGKSPPNSVDF